MRDSADVRTVSPVNPSGMSPMELQAHWHAALAAASSAVETCRRERILTPAECQVRLALIHDEERWLADGRWTP
jgi:hypothetical protein